MNNPSSSGRLHLAATVLLLGSTFAVSRLMAYRTPGFLAKPLNTLELQIGDFKGRDNPPLSDEILTQLHPTSYLVRTYTKPYLAADLFVAFYAQQRAGESMHSPKHCLPGAGWEIWDYGSLEIPVKGHPVKINKYSISREGTRMVVLYWYQSKGRIIASEYMGKILLARDALLQNSTAAAIVRIVVPDKPGVLNDATSMAEELIPQIQRCFGK
jgi:EpsI family protein